MLFWRKNAFKRGEVIVFALTNLILHCSTCLLECQRLHCIALEQLVCKTCVFRAQYRVLEHLTLFPRKCAFKTGDSIVFTLTNLILHGSTCLLAWQRFHRVETISVQKTPFSTQHRVLAHVTLFSRKHGESLVFALNDLIMHNSTCLLVWQHFNRVETVSVQKTRFQHALTRFSASNVHLAEKRGKTQEIAFLCKIT